jgi:hypothetical protein
MNWSQTLALFINTHRKGGSIPAGVISVADEEDLVHSGLEDTMIEAYANVQVEGFAYHTLILQHPLHY